MSRQKSHVSPSEYKIANPSTSPQFSLVNWAQDNHRGPPLAFRTKLTSISSRATTDGGVGQFGDRWLSLTLTLNLAHGICRTINATVERQCT